MNKNIKTIAENISNNDIYEMLVNAKREIKDWTEPSCVNRSFTKGKAWNILTKDLNPNSNERIRYVFRLKLVQEFGRYLPENLKPCKREKKNHVPYHEEPNFNNVLLEKSNG